MKKNNLKLNSHITFVGILLTTFLILISSFANSLKAQQTAKRDENGRGYLEYLPPDYNSNTDLYPVIIFLHGQGERGDGSPAQLERVKKHGPPKHIKNGHNMCFDNNGKQECFIVLSPQQTTNTYNWWAPDVMTFVETAKDKYRIDPARIYLMGLSMGGQGTWRTAYSEENGENIFAALAIAPGIGNYDDACKIAQDGTAVWAFHGTNDNSMSLYSGRRPVTGMQDCNAEPAPIFTVYEGVGHNSWDRAFRTDNSIHTPNVYQWLLAQSKQGSTNSNPPTAPSNLSSSYKDSQKVKLKWNDNSNNETNFLIERSLNSSKDFSVIRTTSNNVTNYEDNNLAPNTQYYYRIKAKNNDGVSAYCNTLSVKTEDLPLVPQNEVIIDNKHSSVTLTGDWAISTAGGYSKYESNYLHDDNKQKGSKKATFNVDVNAGTYEVFAWWYAFGNRATNTPFEIKSAEGNTTIYKNQRFDNAKWVSLGTYEFSANAIIEISNNNTDGYVVVDAIKLKALSSGGAAPTTEFVEVILDNQNDGVNTNGNWISSEHGGSSKYEEDYYHDGNSRKGEKSVIFSAPVKSGNYKVFARWYAYSNRATNTPFDIKTTNGTKTVYENQQMHNGRWVSLGEYTFEDIAEVVVRNDNTNGYVVADAIKFVPTNNDNSRMADYSEEIEQITSENITVFPNPVRNNLSIRSPFDKTKVFDIKMRNKSGEIEWKQTVKGIGEIMLNINRASLTSGIKYLSIEVEGQPIKIIQILLL